MNAGKRAVWLLSAAVITGPWAVSSAQEPNIPLVRGTTTEKGSILWFSRIQVAWDESGNLVEDTFIEMSNDYPDDVQVQMYYVNGDEPLRQQGDERPHLGWNWLDNTLLLTGNESAYWAVSNGLPKAVAPFPQLDAGNPPGRPDPNHPGRRIVRGFIVAWAIDNLGVEINWNHLSGRAVIIDYMEGSAWEYLPWSFQARDGMRGSRPDGVLGVLLMNGGEYDLAPGTLLMDFPAVGARLDGGMSMARVDDVELTLHPLTIDFRNFAFERFTTNVRFVVWNMNEVKLTGMERPLTCWDSRLLSRFGVPNHFLLGNLQTDRGYARIDGMGDNDCAAEGMPAALIGVISKRIFFAPDERAEAGVNLVGMGCEEAAILYDADGEPPSEREIREQPQAEPKIRRAGAGEGRTERAGS